MPDVRVQAAVEHWGPRFIQAGAKDLSTATHDPKHRAASSGCSRAR